MAKGYDADDNNLTGSELGKKYQGDILDQKSINFSGLKLSQQKDMLYTAISGKETKTAKEQREGSQHILIIQTVKMLLNSLDKIGKREEWIESSCSMKIFVRLSLEEKTKYHDILIDYHDEEMKKHKQPPKPIDQVTASSPAPVHGGCPPNFDNPNEWEKV